MMFAVLRNPVSLVVWWFVEVCRRPPSRDGRAV